MSLSDLIQTDQTEEAGQEGSSSEPRVCLPKPDINNITVLTESLPNDPILPWHHFDSPWLEKEEAGAEAEPSNQTEPAAATQNDQAEQLALPLDGAGGQEPLEAASL